MRRHAQRGFQPAELPPETQAKIDAMWAKIRASDEEDEDGANE